ncbi:hypothetical protein [Stenotrophomonas sp. AB1(2024)]|uniref:hypothetical protein n=1 Tax=Stenotrophomonas sp. AB1(2024) TaxID=3132215 RepID=UPI0030949B3C
MRHLIAPFFCMLAVGLFLALTVRAVETDAASFVLIGLAGAAFFIRRCWVETHRAWPTFTRHLARRREMRLSPPVIRINPHRDDVQ